MDIANGASRRVVLGHTLPLALANGSTVRGRRGGRNAEESEQREKS